MKNDKPRRSSDKIKLDEKFAEETDKDKNTAGRNKIEELHIKIASLEDQLKRAVADYRNLEARVREEKIDFIKYANKSLIEQLLPAFDTLLLAEKYTEDQNLSITVKHVLEVLKNAGVEKVETVGRPYDSATMEAVDVVEGEPDKVVEESQPGFTINGKIIRPARVKVGGKAE